MSDFGKWVAGGGKVVLAASAEFVNSAAALPAFQKTYGFKLKPEQLIVLSGGDTAATIKAAADQTNGANAAMVYGTDGGIAPSGLVVMDGRQERAAGLRTRADHPRGRAEGEPEDRRDPEARSSQSLDLATLQELNARVQVGGEPAKAVADGLPEVQGLPEVSSTTGSDDRRDRGRRLRDRFRPNAPRSACRCVRTWRSIGSGA